MSRRSLLLIVVLVICALVAVWDLLVWPLIAQPSEATKAESADGGLGSGGWLVAAAVAGAVFTSLGAYLNDFYTRRSEDRRAEREAEEQRQRWEREDRLRREENYAADRQRVREARAQAYKAFVIATTFAPEPTEAQKAALRRELNERYTDVLLYCSDYVVGEAEELYGMVDSVLSDRHHSEFSSEGLRRKQGDFWDAVRGEAERDYSHS